MSFLKVILNGKGKGEGPHDTRHAVFSDTNEEKLSYLTFQKNF